MNVKTKPSITTTLRKSNFYSDEIILKDDYSISLLIPLNAEKTINSDMSQSRFIHFYAGVLMALDQLNLQKIRINLNVVDTEEQGFRISNKFGFS